MSKTLNSKILCVDDEPNILEAFKRQLRGQYDLDIATGGDSALGMISDRGPYAVIVSDMRMPTMDGVEFLRRVRKVAPDTVRLMLTGNADQESAARAVNEGNIFRFLTKPCSAEELTTALDDAAAQYRLVVAEKDLLQNTLSGSVKLLTDILSFVAPASFGQAMKLRQSIHKVVAVLGITNSWDIELAGMLSNLGLVTVPSNIITKYQAGTALSSQERELMEKVPAIGHTLISNIPRLEGVAKTVLHQNRRYDGLDSPADMPRGEDIPLGSRIIKVLKDYSLLEAEGRPAKVCLETMKSRAGWYDLNVLNAVTKMFGECDISESSKPETKIYEIKAHQLFLGQTLLSNVETKDGVLLISSGSLITEPLLERLSNYAKLVGLKEPIFVDCLIPTGR